MEPPNLGKTNKLHEWGAAVLIMIFMGLLLYTFLTFIRGTSL